MSVSKRISDSMPYLKKKLAMAHLNKKPEDYVKEKLRATFLSATTLTFAAILLLLKAELSLFWAIPIFMLLCFILFSMLINSVNTYVLKRAKEIDKDVLFSGRFLLIKLNSGKPLLQAFDEASHSYGVASSYFKEIVSEIQVGASIEEALDRATEYCPSEYMQRILFQINNSLKIGIDVSQVLESILDEISSKQLIELQRYGKKLSSFTLFYMLTAVVVPSLGITMMIIVSSFVSIKIDNTVFFVLLFFLIVFELFFMSLFKSIRPRLNI